MNTVGHFRSNYFAVKDRSAFEAWCQRLSLVVITKEPDLVGFVGSMHESGIPWSFEEVVEGEERATEIDFIGEVGRLLADDHVAMVLEIAHEGNRYLNGMGYAINSKGQCKHIDLAEELTVLAQGLGNCVTACDY